jgi:hypothetical protein
MITGGEKKGGGGGRFRIKAIKNGLFQLSVGRRS